MNVHNVFTASNYYFYIFLAANERNKNYNIINLFFKLILPYILVVNFGQDLFILKDKKKSVEIRNTMPDDWSLKSKHFQPDLHLLF